LVVARRRLAGRRIPAPARRGPPARRPGSPGRRRAAGAGKRRRARRAARPRGGRAVGRWAAGSHRTARHAARRGPHAALHPPGGVPLAPASAAAPAALRALWVAALWRDGLLVGSELQGMMPAVARALRWRRQAAPSGRPALLCGRDGWATLIIRPGPPGTAHV